MSQISLFLFVVFGLVHTACADIGHARDSHSSMLIERYNTNRNVRDMKASVWRGGDTSLWSYRNNTDLAAHLNDLERRCKKFVKIERIGKSVLGENILVIHMSKFTAERPKGQPKVKIVGNLHGDEPTGRVFTVALAEWLCERKDKGDLKASEILDKVDLWLIPTANPDGFTAGKRGNSKGVDLNRDFPDRFTDGASSNWLPRTGKEQKETQVIMDWTLQNSPFVSSLAIHEGALVANYPWDGSKDKSSTYQASPDDATFKHLASKYATNHRKMSLPDNKEFPKGGITNGANWYPIYGSMQDWNYIVASCMELTLEVNNKKWPDVSLLADLFEDNREAMLDFIMRTSFGGFTGIVYGIHNTDRKTGKENIPIHASIRVDDSFMNTTSDSTSGRFHRPLAPGNYNVEVTAHGFKPKLIQISIPEDGSGVFERIYLNKQQQNTNKIVPRVSLDNYSEIQSGIILVVGSGVTLSMLWWIHLSLISRQSARSLMKILKK